MTAPDATYWLSVGVVGGAMVAFVCVVAERWPRVAIGGVVTMSISLGGLFVMATHP